EELACEECAGTAEDDTREDCGAEHHSFCRLPSTSPSPEVTDRSITRYPAHLYFANLTPQCACARYVSNDRELFRKARSTSDAGAVASSIGVEMATKAATRSLPIRSV